MKKASLLAVTLLLAASSGLVPAQEPLPDNTAATSLVKNTSNASSGVTTGADNSYMLAQKNYQKALALSGSGKLEEAVLALREANKLRPDDPQFQFNLGMAYSQVKSYKDAADSFKRAVKFRADWPEANFRLGVVSYVLGRRSQANESYKKLLALNSPLANALFQIIKDNDPVNAAELAQSPEFSQVKFAQPLAASTPTPSTSDTRVNNKPAPKNTNDSSSDDPSLTSVYRVGVGDVLDIRFLNLNLNRSSLYTVIDGGLIELAIAGGSIPVAGLTTDEIQSRIVAELKRRAVEDNAQVSVGIRQYASHTVIITGLVGSAGTKILRREAVPLYVLMAEAQPRLDAGRAVIMRAGIAAQVVDLGDSAALNTVIKPGDVINVTARPQEFYYIAGRVNQPGQKTFQSGITLLQAILAAGGTIRPGDNSIELSRDTGNGILRTTKFSLKDIKNGKIQDPKLHPGDRIEVIN